MFDITDLREIVEADNKARKAYLANPNVFLERLTEAGTYIHRSGDTHGTPLGSRGLYFYRIAQLPPNLR